MMADLVDQDVRDEMLEAVVAVGPFVEDRAAEQADPLGQRARLVDAAARSAARLRRGRSARTGPRCPARASVSSSANSSTSSTTSPRLSRERRGQRVERGARDRLDLGGGGRRSEAAHRRRIGVSDTARQGWRSGRDSNPRYGFAVYSLSRRAPSTTRPPLRYRWKGAPVGKRGGSGNSAELADADELAGSPPAA